MCISYFCSSAKKTWASINYDNHPSTNYSSIHQPDEAIKKKKNIDFVLILAFNGRSESCSDQGHYGANFQVLSEQGARPKVEKRHVMEFHCIKWGFPKMVDPQVNTGFNTKMVQWLGWFGGTPILESLRMVSLQDKFSCFLPGPPRRFQFSAAWKLVKKQRLWWLSGCHMFYNLWYLTCWQEKRVNN